jgi:hypothetical protein
LNYTLTWSTKLVPFELCICYGIFFLSPNNSMKCHFQDLQLFLIPSQSKSNKIPTHLCPYLSKSIRTKHVHIFF